MPDDIFQNNQLEVHFLLINIPNPTAATDLSKQKLNNELSFLLP